MLWKSIQVTARDNGQVQDAKLAACEECQSSGFTVYVIAGQNHPHLQCLECNTCYCSGEGPCVPARGAYN